MLALLVPIVLIVLFAVAVPASAGTWEPAKRVSPLSHFAVSANGSALAGGTTYGYAPNYSYAQYSLVTRSGSIGPARTVASYRGIRTGGFGQAVLDRYGNATMTFAGADNNDSYCCSVSETAWLAEGARTPVARERLDPAGRDRTATVIAAGPSGNRAAAWIVNRRAGAKVLIADAGPGKTFSRPTTVAEEQTQPEASAPTLAIADNGTTWIFWTTEVARGEDVVTAVRVAQRRRVGRQWRVRTLARLVERDGQPLRIRGSTLTVAYGSDGEALVGWKECDRDRQYDRRQQCRIRVRWRRAGTWERPQTLDAESGETAWGLVMDRRGRALAAFSVCARDENRFETYQCTLQVTKGRRGRFEQAQALATGSVGAMASNRRGDVLLLYSWATDGPPYQTNYYARVGSTAGPFEPEVLLQGPNSRPDSSLYQVSLTGLGVDDDGNASFAYREYDSIGGLLFRYRR